MLPVRGLAAKNFQGIERAVSEAACDRAGFFQADDGGVGRLLRGGVLAGGFAELLAGLGHVKYIVDDLEGEADVVAKGGQRGELGRRWQFALMPPSRAEQHSNAEVLRSWMYLS